MGSGVYLAEVGLNLQILHLNLLQIDLKPGERKFWKGSFKCTLGKKLRSLLLVR